MLEYRTAAFYYHGGPALRAGAIRATPCAGCVRNLIRGRSE